MTGKIVKEIGKVCEGLMATAFFKEEGSSTWTLGD